MAFRSLPSHGIGFDIVVELGDLVGQEVRLQIFFMAGDPVLHFVEVRRIHGRLSARPTGRVGSHRNEGAAGIGWKSFLFLRAGGIMAAG
jgi:hypothetical protein